MARKSKLALSRKNVVQIELNVSMEKDKEAENDELLKKRLSAIRLHSKMKEFEMAFRGELRTILEELPVFVFRDEDSMITIRFQGLTLETPLRAPPPSKMVEGKFPIKSKITKLTNDFNLLLGVFFSSLKTPPKKVKIENQIMFILKPKQFMITNVVNEIVLSSLQKTIGVNSVSGIDFYGSDKSGAKKVEYSIKHQVDENQLIILYQTEGDSTAFTVDIESIINDAINDINTILKVIESLDVEMK